MEPFEYAIKKDVRNNPIVREVDEARQRELWKSVGDRRRSWCSCCSFSAWQHFELLRHGYQIEQMEQRARRRGRSGRQLRLEIETLQSPERIEALATEQLHLVAPSADEAIVHRTRAVPARSAGEVDRDRRGTRDERLQDSNGARR